MRRLQHNQSQSPPSLALWYSSTAPLRCAATSAVPSVPGSQASATQREALLLPSGLKDSEVTGRVEVGGARSCARSDSSTTAGRGAAGIACRQGEAELQMSKPSMLRCLPEWTSKHFTTHLPLLTGPPPGQTHRGTRACGHGR